MLEKKMNDSGQKAYQRNDTEDRSLPYRNWLRTVETNGYFLDVDFIKWKIIEGKWVPRAITELTRCDSETAGQNYLLAILERYFVRDRQGAIMSALAQQLGVPAFLVLFQVDMKWVKVYHFADQRWYDYTPENWAFYLQTL